MSTFQGFLFGFVAMIVVGFLIPTLRRKPSIRPPVVHALSGDGAIRSRRLYYFSAGTLIALPALSFVLVSKLGLSPTKAYAFIFIGVGVPLSVAIPFLIAKARGPSHYEEYWQFVTDGSGVSRRTILLILLAVAVLALAMGGAMLISGRP